MLQLGQVEAGFGVMVALVFPGHGKAAAVFLDGIGTAAIGRAAGRAGVGVDVGRAHRIEGALTQGAAPAGHGMLRIVADKGGAVILRIRDAAVVRDGIAAVIRLDPPARVIRRFRQFFVGRKAVVIAAAPEKVCFHMVKRRQPGLDRRQGLAF